MAVLDVAGLRKVFGHGDEAVVALAHIALSADALLAISSDGCAIRMVHDGLREPTQHAAEKAQEERFEAIRLRPGLSRHTKPDVLSCPRSGSRSATSEPLRTSWRIFNIRRAPRKAARKHAG